MNQLEHWTKRGIKKVVVMVLNFHLEISMDSCLAGWMKMEMMMADWRVSMIQMGLQMVAEMDLNCHLEIQMD